MRDHETVIFKQGKLFREAEFLVAFLTEDWLVNLTSQSELCKAKFFCTRSLYMKITLHFMFWASKTLLQDLYEFLSHKYNWHKWERVVLSKIIWQDRKSPFKVIDSWSSIINTQTKMRYIGSTAACCAGKEGLIYAKMN